MINIEDYFSFVDDALEGMVSIVSELGDELANRRPDIPGANSPYVILVHCLGVMQYWGGYLVAGRPVQRDRAAEFQAAGPVGDLVERASRARQQLRTDTANLDPFAPPRGTPRPEDVPLPRGKTQGGALMHLYEDLAQHRGQLEITRDLLLSPWAQVRSVTTDGKLPARE